MGIPILRWEFPSADGSSHSRMGVRDEGFLVSFCRKQLETNASGIRKRYAVHSMDAAHMMLPVSRLYAEGIRHFAMVHDSFGVHAGDIDLLHRVLREEFVRS